MRIPNLVRVGVLIALVAVVPAACGGDGESPTEPGGSSQPASITLSPSSHAFAALQDSIQLTATVKDQQGRPIADASIDWSSTDTAVARVNAKGWVFAVANGSAMIVASVGSLADTAMIAVVQGAAKLELSLDSASFDAVGDSTQVTATLEDTNGNPIDPEVVEWTSTDTTVATVNDDGWIFSRGSGTASIIATAGEAADTVAVEVVQVAVGFDVRQDSVRVGVDATVQLEAAVLDRNNHPIPGRTITWSSANPTIASVDENGLVTGKTRGSKTTVTAKAGEFSDTVQVRVMDQIVFANAAGEIYVANEDGSGSHRLVASGGSNPAWSPDGEKIAYVNSGDIWVMNADGSGKTRLTTEGTNRSPAWSPDGKKIAFASNRGDLDIEHIYVMNADGTGQARLTSTAAVHEGQPVWSPLGDKVAFIRTVLLVGGNVFVINADGTGEQRVSDSGASAGYPVWSPIGNKLAFHQRESGGKSRIWVKNFADNTTEMIGNPAEQADWQFPEWSPSGKQIAFHSNQNGSVQPGIFDLETALLRNGNRSHNGDARYARWSPDGQRVLYAVDGEGLFLWHPYGTDDAILVTDKGGDTSSPQHAWRPRTLHIIIPPIFP